MTPTIRYVKQLPDKSDLFQLFQTTGWNDFYRLSEPDLHHAFERSWHVMSAHHREEIIGCGRIICDGVVHALILDLIVLPAYRNQGIGGKLLDFLVQKCLEHRIRDIQLFCAKGQVDFYTKRGFYPRPEIAPGMEYRQKDFDKYN